MGGDLLFLLLPIAAFSGWLIGRFPRKGRPESSRRRSGSFSGNYFKGLNFILNEQPDQAIDVFVQMLEVDNDTVDTHFALANLFRRRGEVERAIRIHQNIIARPTLILEQRNKALFELGVDYLRAGLYDRAETLFAELIDQPDCAKPALINLLNIFEQEKEWQKAITAADRLKLIERSNARDHVIAHYYCELAIKEHALNDPRAPRTLRQALTSHKGCVRATLIEAEWAIEQNNYRLAIKHLQRINQQDPTLYSEAVPLLQQAYEMAGRKDELLGEIERTISRYGDNETLRLAYARLLNEERGHAAAENYLTQLLQQMPTIPLTQMFLQLATRDDKDQGQLKIISDVMGQFSKLYPSYQCNNCGYSSTTHEWHCPSCKEWDSITSNG